MTEYVDKRRFNVSNGLSMAPGIVRIHWRQMHI